MKYTHTRTGEILTLVKESKKVITLKKANGEITKTNPAYLKTAYTKNEIQ